MEKKIFKFNYRKLIFNNKFIFVMLFMSILLYSNLYSHTITPLDALLKSITSSATPGNKTMPLLLVGVFKSSYVQLAINITTAIFSIYMMSLLLLLLAKIDIRISSTIEKIHYYEIVDAYIKSLYVIICDFLFKSFYIIIVGKAYELSRLTITYGFIINIIQCWVIFRFLKYKENSLILTKIMYLIAISALFIVQLLTLL
ncbi:hypothetical protein [Clostridium psychrophilum]|uniref:hypothetical protein n=1 Tax=Clostridium psychrophilum TaxID=132926 RepID=UPI001C0AB672|nr:hypothetical protein [Clostridium psychrophilum]MBU3182549.1 hypothetical protein [Clostridium psychrophilum]